MTATLAAALALLAAASPPDPGSSPRPAAGATPVAGTPPATAPTGPPGPAAPSGPTPTVKRPPGPRPGAEATAAKPAAAAPVGASATSSKPAPGGADDGFLRLYAETRGFRAGRPTSVKVVPGASVVLFLRSGPRSRVQALHAMRLPSGETWEIVSEDGLSAGGAAEPGGAERARLERQRITARGVTAFQLSTDGETILASAGGRHLLVDRPGGRLRELALPVGALDPRLSPDARRVAYVADRELHVLDLASGEARQLTRGAGESVTRGLAEFVAQEEMGRQEGYWWSPDSRLLLFQETDEEPVEKLAIPDPAHPELAAPRFAYPRAGRENARVRLGVVSASGGEVRWLEWDRERYPYLARVRWEEGGPPLVLVQNRAQTEEALFALDPGAGAWTRLLVEDDPSWLNLHPDLPRWLPDGSGFLWFTERNGAAELELRRPSGSLAESLVAPGGFVGLAGIDPSSGWIYYTSTRLDPTQDRVYRVRPGSRPEEVPIQVERPTSISAELARDGSALVVSATGPDGVRRSVHRPDGTAIAAVPSVAADPPLRPGVEVRRVGPRGLWASVVKPRDFRPGRRYPVLVEVYGGPVHLEPVLRQDKVLSQWKADQGFIVVSVLNRGATMRLGRSFERAVKGDFAGPTLDDQVDGLRALAAEIPEMDLSRVGITGWSFGGYMAALAVLRRPDVFHAAVAGAPVADWRDYDTHYTERYLGLPSEAPGAYERSSLLGWVKEPSRPLLLVHGTADDNVHFLHSIRLADALFRAGRPATFVPLAGTTHLPADPPAREMLLRSEVDFLKRALARPSGDGAPGAKP
jgi:dipeptidyl-peptidase-4